MTTAAAPKALPLPLRLDIRMALTTTPPTPDFVLPGLPTGTVGAVVAPGATGKTLWLLQVCVALAAGVPIMGGHLFPEAGHAPLAPAKVVLVVAEETADLMHARLHAAFGELLAAASPDLLTVTAEQLVERLAQNLNIYPLAGRGRLLLDGADPQCDGLAVLHQLSADARLVAIDPLRQFHAGDENDSWTMTKLLQDLQGLACRRNCAVLVAHHTNKWSTTSGQGDKAGASRGSAAFTDNVRWQLNMSALDDELAAAYGIEVQDARGYVRLDLPKVNYLPPQAPVVARRGKGGAFSAVALPRASATRKSSAKASRKLAR
jgi:regulatory protein RepA